MNLGQYLCMAGADAVIAAAENLSTTELMRLAGYRTEAERNRFLRPYWVSDDADGGEAIRVDLKAKILGRVLKGELRIRARLDRAPRAAARAAA